MAEPAAPVGTTIPDARRRRRMMGIVRSPVFIRPASAVMLRPFPISRDDGSHRGGEEDFERTFTVLRGMVSSHTWIVAYHFPARHGFMNPGIDVRTLSHGRHHPPHDP